MSLIIPATPGIDRSLAMAMARDWTFSSSIGASSWSRILTNGSRLVAVAGAAGGVSHSTDYGVTWTAAVTPPGAGNYFAGCWSGNSYFVLVSTNGTISRSTDGINWASPASPAANAWRSVCGFAGALWAVSSTGAGNRMMKSTNDGAAWSLVATANDATPWYSITGGLAGSGIIVAGGDNGVDNSIMRSTDSGATWALVSHPWAGDGVREIVWGGGSTFFGRTSNKRLIVSIDNGASWQKMYQNSVLDIWHTSLIYGGGVIGSVGNSGMHVFSDQGDKADMTNFFAASWTHGVYLDRRFYIVGSGGTNRLAISAPLPPVTYG